MVCISYKNRFVKDFFTSRMFSTKRKNSNATIRMLGRGIRTEGSKPHKIKVLCVCVLFYILFYIYYYALTSCRRAYDQQITNEVNHYSSPLAITTIPILIIHAFIF